MKTIVLKTFEITKQQWKEIVEGYNKAFGTNKEIDVLIDHYNRTIKKYSYHVLALDEESGVVGYNSLLPMPYTNSNGDDIEIGVSGGTFVELKYRNDIFIFSDMIKSLLEYSSDDGVVAMIGVPNENSFQYSLKFLDSKLITFLNYYCLPIRIFNILKIRKLSILNSVSAICVRFMLECNIILSKIFNSSEKRVQFELKTDEQFLNARFGNEKYKRFRSQNFRSFYRITSENGIRTAYLLDFRENNTRTFRALLSAVKNIIKDEKPDIILFIGHLRLQQFLFFKIPKRFEPQSLPLTFNITSEKYNSYYEDMLKERNWNFGLMNFDVR